MHDRSEPWDLVVVGLGAMGSALLWHARRSGLDVCGIDQFEPPHTLGSSHAETRITRLAVGEGDQYLPFVARSHELWRELEGAIGRQLFFESGGYILSQPGAGDDRWGDFTAATAAIAARAGVEYQVLSAEQLRSERPDLHVPDRMSVGFEPSAGVVLCEQAVRAQIELAVADGATAMTACKVQSVEPNGDHVVVSIDDGAQLRARDVVVAAGAWTPGLVPSELGGRLRVTRQVAFWFEVDDMERFRPENFPFVMWIDDSIEEYVGVFPSPVGTFDGVKVLGEQFSESTTPSTVDRNVTDEETAEFHRRLVAPRFAGISDRCLRREVCLYTNTPDDHFLIDHDPRSSNITVMSPCSGHGFKHSTALAEAVVQRIANGTSQLDLDPFRVPN